MFYLNNAPDLKSLGVRAVRIQVPAPGTMALNGAALSHGHHGFMLFEADVSEKTTWFDDLTY